MESEPNHPPTYSYQPLPEGAHIRLLKLHPGKYGDTIRCHLELLSLKDASGTYESVSYVWGDSSQKRHIVIDDHSFYVGKGLFEALQHFRDPTITRTLWVDAICIQQTNPPEKGRQVNMMGRIYEHGLRTLVWLGPDTSNVAQETTAFLKTTSQTFKDLAAKYGSIAKIPALADDENPISQDVQKWKLFVNFLDLVWFSRGWVMQEVGIAPDVTMHWGDATVRFSDVINVNNSQRYASHLLPVNVMSWHLYDGMNGLFAWYGNEETWRSQLVPSLIEQAEKEVPEPNFVDALIQSSRREFTDLRDHVFALLGHPLAVMGNETIVKADYEVHVDDVFLEVAAKLLKYFIPELVLAVAADMGRRRERDLNSEQSTWVPRYELELETGTLGRPGQWYHAGGRGERLPIDIDTEAKTLSLRGFVFDRITWFSKQIRKPDIELDLLMADPSHHSAIDWLWDDLSSMPCRYRDEQARRDAFTLSLVAGRYRGVLDAEEDVAHHRRIAKAYSEYLASVTTGDETSASDGARGLGDPKLRALARDYEDEFTWTSHDRRFMLTEKGFYAIGPQLLRVGDVVALFPGMMVPFVLRPTDDGESYKLVGSCYMHGVMRGELLEPEDPLDMNCKETQRIVLV